MTDLDGFFARAATGDAEAFANWVGRVERPIRSSLGRFARAVDVEGVVQETLLRMWRFARERAGGLEGENASLRFAIGMARNIARGEARRMGRHRFLPPEDLPDGGVDPEPVADDRLRAFIVECLELLAGRPREALRLRLEFNGLPDRVVAGFLRMTLNTFLQNIVRARRQVLDCLARKGVPPEDLVT